MVSVGDSAESFATWFIMKFILRSFLIHFAADTLYLAGYGILGIYVGTHLPSWVNTYNTLGTLVWLTLNGFCFALWRFNMNETGYSVTAYCVKNYVLRSAPPREGKLSGGLIAWYFLVLILTWCAFMYFSVNAPKTADLAREYKRIEQSVFAAHVSLDEVVEKNAGFFSLREGVLRHDLLTKYNHKEADSGYGVVPVMRSQATLDPEVRVWFVCSPAWHAINHPLQFSVLGLLSASEHEIERKAIEHAMQEHNLKSHPAALIVGVFSYGADQKEALANIERQVRDEISDKLVFWLIFFGSVGLGLGLMGYAAAPKIDT